MSGGGQNDSANGGGLLGMAANATGNNLGNGFTVPTINTNAGGMPTTSAPSGLATTLAALQQLQSGSQSGMGTAASNSGNNGKSGIGVGKGSILGILGGLGMI